MIHVYTLLVLVGDSELSLFKPMKADSDDSLGVLVSKGTMLSDDDLDSISREESPCSDSPRPASLDIDNSLDNMCTSVSTSTSCSVSTKPHLKPSGTPYVRGGIRGRGRGRGGNAGVTRREYGSRQQNTQEVQQPVVDQQSMLQHGNYFYYPYFTPQHMQVGMPSAQHATGSLTGQPLYASNNMIPTQYIPAHQMYDFL